MTPAILNLIGAKSIPNGTKFFALYGDGSGGKVFVITDEGHLFDGDGEHYGSAPDQALQDHAFIWWVELPKIFKMFMEEEGVI